MRVSKRDRTLLVDILAGITGRDVPGGLPRTEVERFNTETTIRRCIAQNLTYQVGDYLYLTDTGLDIALEAQA